MNHNIVHTLHDGERVTSTYAEIYLNDNYCRHETSRNQLLSKKSSNLLIEDENKNEWVSPSDLLIGILELQPPFTSKITRGQTHEGILAIGDAVMENERSGFLKRVNHLLNENNAAWNMILEYEKTMVIKHLKNIYDNIFKVKSTTMMKEIMLFYENTLEELEKHFKLEVQHVLISAHAGIINTLNTTIQKKLKKEKQILEEVLVKRYHSEVQKIKTYYELLLKNEQYRNNKLINHALYERNDALNAFYRQIEAETLTSTMYIMCMERKKCKIQKFILNNYQSMDIRDKLQIIKNKQGIIETFKVREEHISDINREWENKIQKVLQLFLKFVSFSLKLLPEQATFLLDFEKMVVLQLKEIKKMPQTISSVLVDEENIFNFEKTEPEETLCVKEPFVIVGDLTESIPPSYGSRETLSSGIDLPTITLDRKYVYAKCHKFEEIKDFIESQYCKCLKVASPPSPASLYNESVKSMQPIVSSESSNETILIDDMHRLDQCPVHKCIDWAGKSSFPYLDSYLDFTEENFERVKTIIGKPSQMDVPPEILNPKNIVFKELPFSATKERYHNAETQYSSQEDLKVPVCTCTDVIVPKQNELMVSQSKAKEILVKRKNSIREIMQQNPNLLKIFTDECFDFQL